MSGKENNNKTQTKQNKQTNKKTPALWSDLVVITTAKVQIFFPVLTGIVTTLQRRNRGTFSTAYPYQNGLTAWIHVCKHRAQKWFFFHGDPTAPN